MAALLIFIHTVPPLVGVFDHLARVMLDDVAVKHILDEPLLEDVRQRGGLAPEDADRLLSHARISEQIGAKAILVTCSTVSPLVDTVRKLLHTPLIKIDEAMIERAVLTGDKIHVLATNPTTLNPTRQLLMEQAKRLGRKVEVSEQLVEGALSALLSGDGDIHDQLLRKALRESSGNSAVVVLAQASMARVLDTLTEAERTIPVLSSPHLALERIKEFL